MLDEFSPISKFVKNLFFSVFPEILLLSFYDVLYNMYDEKLNVINENLLYISRCFPFGDVDRRLGLRRQYHRLVSE